MIAHVLVAAAIVWATICAGCRSCVGHPLTRIRTADKRLRKYLMNRSEIILQVQETLHLEDRGDAEAQLIAEAIATFQSNDGEKHTLAGLAPVQHRLIPEIVSANHDDSRCMLDAPFRYYSPSSGG